MNKVTKRVRRQTRVRKKVQGTKEKPRLSVFRSNQYMYAQIIDDATGITLLSISEKKLSKAPPTGRAGLPAGRQEAKASRLEKAKMVGLEVAKLAGEKKVKQIVFDKGRYAYHGRVKAVAEGAREGGLQF
ncbi:MAG: 50S ribosomal protein L18 [Candidatus Levybacteria bacterium]|nr:50S ribosomal protein L18 [Candidatus Levybacteria bacterium]